MTEEVYPLSEVREKFTKSLCLAINPDEMDAATLNEIKMIIDSHKGNIPVYINVKTNGNGEFVLKSKSIAISPNAALIDSLRNLIGRENVWIGA